MGREIKLRLILIVVSVLLIGSSYFFSGNWKDEFINGEFYHGKPVFEYWVIQPKCGGNMCTIGMDNNIFFGVIGIVVGLTSLYPIRLTPYKIEVKE